MKTQYDYDVLVIGAQAAGLIVARGLARSGKKVLVIEKDIGVHCASLSCIPRKALIASANIAHELWCSSLYGITMDNSNFNSDRVLERVRNVVDVVLKKNHPSTLHALGIDTLDSSCSFIDPYTVQVSSPSGESRKIRAETILIALGSEPIIPTIRGLSDIPYYTNDTIYSLKEIPASLAIIGGGNTGCELAQAFRRLGSSVTLIEQSDYLLSSEEPEVFKAVQSALVKEDVEIFLGYKVEQVYQDNDKITLHVQAKTDAKRNYELHVNQVLICAGRRPNLKSLNLEQADVTYTQLGLKHDEYGKTSQSNIWVVGDASGPSFYSHTSINHAETVLSNMLAPKILRQLLPAFFQKKMNDQAVPRILFTDPEVACLGLTEQQAIEKYGTQEVRTIIVPLSEADRALCQGRYDGFVKFVTKRLSSKILGVSIVAPIAADMLVEVSLAMINDVPLCKLSNVIHPYPTYSQIIQKAAYNSARSTLFGTFSSLFSKRSD